MEIRHNFRVSTYASAFSLFDMEPHSMSPSDPQRRRNGQRGGMSLVDQLYADLVIEFGILIQFPLAEKL